MGYAVSTATKRPKSETAVEEFIRQVRQKLEERELSISELARLTGFTRPYLSRMLSGHQVPSMDVADKIATELGLKVTTESV